MECVHPIVLGMFWNVFIVLSSVVGAHSADDQNAESVRMHECTTNVCACVNLQTCMPDSYGLFFIVTSTAQFFQVFHAKLLYYMLLKHTTNQLTQGDVPTHCQTSLHTPRTHNKLSLSEYAPNTLSHFTCGCEGDTSMHEFQTTNSGICKTPFQLPLLNGLECAIL